MEKTNAAKSTPNWYRIHSANQSVPSSGKNHSSLDEKQRAIDNNACNQQSTSMDEKQRINCEQ
jgi:hypothetical protein